MLSNRPTRPWLGSNKQSLHRTQGASFTQSISRTRWFVVRWLTVALALVVLSSVLAVVTSWWFGHVQTNATAGYFAPFADRIQPVSFDVTGIVPVAYTLFAFALGAALGAFLRRRAWAGLVTLVAFIAARVSFEHLVRQHLAGLPFQPLDLSTGGGVSLQYKGPVYWTVGFAYRHIPGSRFPSSGSYVSHVANDTCVRPGDFQRCLTAHGVQYGYYYQPESHYWALQWGEASAFVVAAAVLFGLTLWAVRRWRA